MNKHIHPPTKLASDFFSLSFFKAPECKSVFTNKKSKHWNSPIGQEFGQMIFNLMINYWESGMISKIANFSDDAKLFRMIIFQTEYD